MDNDTTNQPQGTDPYAPQNQPVQQPMPAAGVPTPQQPSTAPQDYVAAQPQQQQPQRAPLRIDHNLLAELGLAALPDEEKKALEKHIYETLEMRVGMRLADQMTNEQLDEFETYFNARDDAGAFRWLENNFPNYKDIVAEEFDKLKSEVAGQAPAILAASQQQAVQGPADAGQALNNSDAQSAPQPPAQPAMPQQQTPPPMPPEWPTTPSPDQQPPQTPAQ